MPTVFRQHPKLGVLSTSSAKRIKVGRMFASTLILLSVQYWMNCSNVNESLIRSFLQVCTSSSRRFKYQKRRKVYFIVIKHTAVDRFEINFIHLPIFFFFFQSLSYILSFICLREASLCRSFVRKFIPRSQR